MGIAINPSILSADFANLQRELERISTADAAYIDVMDNHFVPNLTWGPPVVKRLREISPVPFDVHLMIEDADRWAPEYASMGCESVTFHAEAAIAPIKLARTLRAEGAKAGMALRPATAVEPYLDMLGELDMLLIMTVEPGFGGQAFLDVTLPKIARAAKAIEGANLPVTVQVDGMTVQTNDKLVYMAFNKPAGVVSTMEDPEGRPCISDFLRSSMSERVFHVGRLDVETEGLLLLTNDGELANRLTHPSYEVPKTYLVQVPGPMEPGVGAAMKKGIRLEDGVTRVDEFKLVDSTPGHVLVEVTIHSGKNRIVRRLFDAVGYPVERLVRVEMGPIRIGSQKQGTVRNLSKVEIGHLLASVDM